MVTSSETLITEVVLAMEGTGELQFIDTWEE